MKVAELVGKDIMKAYDGHYLSWDFGYSCANFNVKGGYSFGVEDNDENTFDFYTLNTKNVSCFVCYNDEGRICGRRMLFKGKSLLNHDAFDMPYKMGTQAIYLYGYYGAHNQEVFNLITRKAVEKYGSKLIHTDKYVIVDGRPNYHIENYFVIQVERADFEKYPPIDFLKIAPSIRALSNFDPSDEVIEILREDTGVNDIEFFSAYRYNPNRGRVKYNYTTWDQHHGKATADDSTFIEEEDDEDDLSLKDKIDSLKAGDSLVFKSGGTICKINSITDKSVFLNLPNGKEFELPKEDIHLFFNI